MDTKPEFMELLNALSEMQRSDYYRLRKHTLYNAENAILTLQSRARDLAHSLAKAERQRDDAERRLDAAYADISRLQKECNERIMSELLREEFINLTNYDDYMYHVSDDGKFISEKMEERFEYFCLGRQSAPEKAAGSEWIPIEEAPDNQELIVTRNFMLGDDPAGQFYVKARKLDGRFYSVDEYGQEYEPGWLTHFVYPLGAKNLDQWISVYDRMPKGEEIVFIHVTGLWDHGLTTAWFHSDGEDSCWVVLDDAINYDFSSVDYWMPVSVKLPK